MQERGHVTTPLLPSRRREAGAVNATWLIVIMILWLGTLYLLYVANDSIAVADQRSTAALAERDDWESRFDEMNTNFNALSQVAGYTDGTPNAKSDVTSVRSDLESVKTTLGDVAGEANVTLDASVKKLMAELASARTASSAVAADYKKERSSRQAAEQKTVSIEGTYKSQVASLTQQLADAQDAADRQAASDQSRIDDITNVNTSLDSDKRDAERALADATDDASKAAKLAADQLVALAENRAPLAPAEPDGKLVTVTDAGDVAWIDLGGKNGLKTGTRFELLRRGPSGELVSRGKVEVREVSSTSAMVGLVGKPNVYDPMLPGDLVRNPHFNKDRVMHFHLLGEFPLNMSKEFATQRLEELGAKVDGSVGTSTDVLVLGETSLDEGDDAVALTDTDAYRTAEKFGIRIILLPELASFLKY